MHTSVRYDILLFLIWPKPLSGIYNGETINHQLPTINSKLSPVYGQRSSVHDHSTINKKDFGTTLAIPYILNDERAAAHRVRQDRQTEHS